MLWLAVIALESTSVFTGEATENWIAPWLRRSGFNWRDIAITNHVVRKIGHFTGYALLSWFAFRGWIATVRYQQEKALLRAGKSVIVRSRWHARAAALAILSTILVAGLDEFHQSFIPGRTGVLRDVILDSMGGLFAQYLLLLWWTRNERKAVRRNVDPEELLKHAAD